MIVVAGPGPWHPRMAVPARDPAGGDVDHRDRIVLLLRGDDRPAIRGNERVVRRPEHLARPEGAGAGEHPADPPVRVDEQQASAADIDRAVRNLEAVVAEDGNHDGALYMLGVGYALRNDARNALIYLRRAIARNPANRLAALQDGDLERLLQDDSVRAALEGNDSSADA